MRSSRRSPVAGWSSSSAKACSSRPLAARGVGAGAAVELVADDRESQARQVNANLVAPPGHELNLQQRAPALEGELAHARLGRLALARGARAHPPGVVAVAADRRVDGLLSPRKAPGHDGQVELAHVASRHLGVKLRLRRGIEREEHEPCRVHVEPLHRLGRTSPRPVAARRAATASVSVGVPVPSPCTSRPAGLSTARSHASS